MTEPQTTPEGSAQTSSRAMRDSLDRLVARGSSGPGCLVDCQAALERLDGDWEFFRDLLQYFFNGVPSGMAEIAAAIDAGDDDRLSKVAHRLKGFLSNFDARSAVEATLPLERVNAGFSQELARVDYQRLEREVQAVREALAVFLAPQSQ